MLSPLPPRASSAAHAGDRPGHGYHSLDVIFNDQSFYANVQVRAWHWINGSFSARLLLSRKPLPQRLALYMVRHSPQTCWTISR